MYLGNKQFSQIPQLHLSVYRSLKHKFLFISGVKINQIWHDNIFGKLIMGF